MPSNFNPNFCATDYVVFVSLLIASLAIGVYYGFISKRKQNTTTEYLLGGKKMETLPVALSLIATLVSGVAFIAIPAQLYSNGPGVMLMILAIILSGIWLWYIYLPVFNDLQLQSSFEYLEKRFDHSVRILASVIYSVGIIVNVPVAVYIPALVFEQTTGISIHYVTPVTCLICMFYTSFGGFRAVIWTDTLQFLSMMGGLLAMIYLGLASTGFTQVLEAGLRGRRLEMNMNRSPFLDNTFWSMIIGLPLIRLANCVDPASAQRFLSLPKRSGNRNALIVMVIGISIILSANCFIGLLIYAYFESCDPLTSGSIEKIDQIVPYFLMDVLGKYPGIPGLFVAAIFSAALSTMSSGWNNLAGTIYDGFIRPVKPNASEKWASNIMKLIVLGLGFITLGLVFVVEKMGPIFALSQSFTSITSGVLLGTFTFGIMFRNGNTVGVKVGSITAFLFLATICIGSQFIEDIRDSKTLPIRTDGCPYNPNNTLITSTHGILAKESHNEDGFTVFKISYMYYTPIALVIVFLLGSIVSFFTGGYSAKNEKLFCPFMRKERKLSSARGEQLQDDGMNITDQKLNYSLVPNLE